MAENHYVDPKDQRIAAEGVEDHSDLTTFYIEANHEELGPWMQEGERQKALEAERNKIAKGLRTSIVPIGLFLGLPVIFGIILGQIALSGIVKQQDADAMAYVIGMIFAAGITLAITLGLFKWISNTFHNHALRALPITLTVLASILFVTQNLFDSMDQKIGGLVGYAIALGSLLILSIFISGITIFMWTTPKVSGLIKVLFLLVVFGAAVAVHYLV